ncbi:hypothetical protein LN996_08690 [Arthrobacter sp. AK01]|uniref:hypothetical protein n=1 Tax=Micrococcaceae TaxID=1268 RepID=UPI001E612603|nr:MULTISPECIES: hypothetical protein [Micrococcaceae]MCD4850881.1 hypothetical protein [Arthrobacter sp. AK01]MCP1414209.1 phenylacetate-coenzyme A ligase PaaK-like adenylate-forming protein [Paenarthrobacter sp. A20]
MTSHNPSTVLAPPEAELINLVVERISKQFPWYAELAKTDAPSLSTLPLINQAILEKHYYLETQVPNGTDTYFTSGTSGGTRKRILYGEDDDNAYVAQRRQLFDRFLTGVPRGSNAVADLGTGHAAASARRIFEEMGLQSFDIDFQRPISEHISLLNEWQPDVLFTMPMILDQLMQQSAALQISPRKIIVVGDLATAAWRQRVASHFGIQFNDVLDLFGSIEIGAIAYSDATTGRYKFHSHIIPELVNYEEVTRGHARGSRSGSGILVLTSISRRYFPAIRYVTGDSITDLRKETSGEWTFERIEGRQVGDFKHGERISSHDLCEAMATVFPAQPFEVLDGNAMTIRVVGSVSDNQRKEFRRYVHHASPDIAVMTDAGLVGEILIQSVNSSDALVSGAKRRFNVRSS